MLQLSIKKKKKITTTDVTCIWYKGHVIFSVMFMFFTAILVYNFSFFLVKSHNVEFVTEQMFLINSVVNRKRVEENVDSFLRAFFNDRRLKTCLKIILFFFFSSKRSVLITRKTDTANSKHKNLMRKSVSKTNKKKVHPAHSVYRQYHARLGRITHKHYTSHNTRNNQPTDIWLGRRNGDDTTESEVLSDLSSSGSF